MRVRLHVTGGRIEVHANKTYRVVSPNDSVLATVQTLRRLSLSDAEIGKVLIAITEPQPHHRAVTLGL